MALNARRLMFLGLALFLSLGAALFAQQWMTGEVRRAALRNAQRPSGPPPAQVLVARQSLPTGTILKADDLRWQTWPTGASVEGYLTDAATNPARLAGAVIRNPLSQGEPLAAGNVVQPGDRGFMAAVLRPGMRAVTINVSASTGVAGFVVPGDHVDLILSRLIDQGGGAKRFVSETLLHDLRVVGVDQRANSDKSDKSDKKETPVPQTATLEVTPKQAEVVSVAGELGKLSMSLRSLAADPAPASPAVSRTWDSEATGEAALALRPSDKAAVAPRRRVAQAVAPLVEVVRGSQVSGSPGSNAR